LIEKTAHWTHPRKMNYTVYSWSTTSIEEDERGETDIVQLVIDTGDAPPQKQPVRRVPFAARQELANLLQSMQESKVIQPSTSPWASPVVLVRKKDGSVLITQIEFSN